MELNLITSNPHRMPWLSRTKVQDYDICVPASAFAPPQIDMPSNSHCWPCNGLVSGRGDCGRLCASWPWPAWPAGRWPFPSRRSKGRYIRPRTARSIQHPSFMGRREKNVGIADLRLRSYTCKNMGHIIEVGACSATDPLALADADANYTPYRLSALLPWPTKCRLR